MMQLAAALNELGEAAPPVMADVAELPPEGEVAPPPPPASPPKQEKGGKGGKGKKGGGGAKAKPVGPDPAMMVEIRIETTPTLTTRVATHAGLCEALENVRAAGRYHREGNPTGNNLPGMGYTGISHVGDARKAMYVEGGRGRGKGGLEEG